MRNCTVRVVKRKALLICTFVNDCTIHVVKTKSGVLFCFGISELESTDYLQMISRLFIDDILVIYR